MKRATRYKYQKKFKNYPFGTYDIIDHSIRQAVDLQLKNVEKPIKSLYQFYESLPSYTQDFIGSLNLREYAYDVIRDQVEEENTEIVQDEYYNKGR